MGKLLILIIAIGAAVGFYVYQSPSSNPDQELATSSAVEESAADTTSTGNGNTEKGEGVFSHMPGFVDTAREGQQAADSQLQEMDKALDNSN